ncbi:MAG: hypothetical protein ACK5ST_00835 [bacterium]
MWIKPGVTTEFRLSEETQLYSGLSYIGSGMLISVGAYDGFERGATTSFARRAWEEAGLVKWNKVPV